MRKITDKDRANPLNTKGLLPVWSFWGCLGVSGECGKLAEEGHRYVIVNFSRSSAFVSEVAAQGGLAGVVQTYIRRSSLGNQPFSMPRHSLLAETANLRRRTFCARQLYDTCKSVGDDEHLLFSINMWEEEIQTSESFDGYWAWVERRLRATVAMPLRGIA